MQCLFQRNWHTAVRLEGQKLLTEVTYCGTDREVCARLIVDPKTFIVKEAIWEIYRTPEEAGFKTLKIAGLEGMEAYFDCGGTLRDVLNPLRDPYAVGLFAEAVRGIIQAETFLLEERGFASPEAYEKFWDSIYKESCRYYRNLDRVTCKWYEHIGYHTRRGSLFNRMKNQSLALNNKDSYLLTGNFNDSFHGVAIKLKVERETGKVIRADSTLLRVVDKVCGEAAAFMKELEGKQITGFKKKDIAQLLGAADGCVHLIDLVDDGRETLELQQSFLGG